MIKRLTAKNVGLEPKYEIDFGDRLNIFTGDNGLGKSFVLEMIWWGLTGEWINNEAYPRKQEERETFIKVKGQYQNRENEGQNHFRPNLFNWTRYQPVTEAADIVIYAGLDGEFAIWDSVRNKRPKPLHPEDSSTYASGRPIVSDVYHFRKEDVWNGLPDPKTGRLKCNGINIDLVDWQLNARGIRHAAYLYIQDVLRIISGPSEELRIGTPKRLFPGDSFESPFLHFSYGEVPVVFCSTAVKRILSLSYMIVWAWTEHLTALKSENPAGKEIILIIDEIEAHLHPKWQRSIIRSLLADFTHIFPGLKIQIIVTTHSPLVLAAAEPYFNEEIDKLFLFSVNENNEVSLNEHYWLRRGDVVGWLTSDIFGLDEARSYEAEIAIKNAEEFMSNKSDKSREEIESELEKVMPDIDKFWARWNLKK